VTAGGPGSERDQARFWAKVALPNEQGCMLWLAYADPDGYGRFRSEGEARRAHRISYALAYGPIPEGLVLDHLCRNRRCVAPDHLEVVTRGENVLRGETVAAAHLAKTHCRHGHAFTGDNVYLYRGKHRRCRTCARNRGRAQRATA
jgi:hypothetical protein